jgi:hypothetical protein
MNKKKQFKGKEEKEKNRNPKKWYTISAPF